MTKQVHMEPLIQKNVEKQPTTQYEQLVSIDDLAVQTDVNKTYQFAPVDRVSGTFNGHVVYMSSEGVACRDCTHAEAVPPLIRAADPVTQIAYRLYLFGKLIDKSCIERRRAIIRDGFDQKI